MPEYSFNDLPAHVWPQTATRDDDGVVHIGGVALTELAARYGTPLFVVDEADFRARCRAMAAAFHGAANVHYASKAFLTRTIARWVKEEGLSLDVASGNELAVALRAGFPAARITAHGNNKSTQFLRTCVEEKVGHVVLDNHGELAALADIAAEAGVRQPVMVRVKPGVEAHTNEMIATAHEDQKFGFSLADGAAWNAVTAVVDSPHLELVGLHCHIGSQIFDAGGFNLAAARVLELYGRVHDELDVRLPELDLGGGYGIAYTADQQPLDVEALAREMLEAVREHAEDAGIEAPTVLVEPGRAIVGPSTVTVYTVGFNKTISTSETDTRRYVAVDGGMSDNIRPALYGAQYDARLVNRRAAGKLTATRVVGSHCESGDILISDEDYPDDLTTGDLLAVANTGAYGYAMASNYNLFTRPAVVTVCDGEVTTMLRRETVDDLLSLEDGEF
ncbi:diaminopimelate decarboxylase [Corynebacterium yudongzhengii]|uniref:Diaminopimelate decarboxylase n=1 Tax=Corynebacterium yudongzhengii TaxID=2080740 RepID=A0A2U1T9H0_9CORY|nr:diaminopimelate decarboxylase [Corynebacterium yudongzhengii]AWB82128.1 diaminopimelate decarboxylase [Corynebacterium yudongzhengii]PWC02632.1 diaminopimelate decarboxylase [Corynebacterium yudongzhengii]